MYTTCICEWGQFVGNKGTEGGRTGEAHSGGKEEPSVMIFMCDDVLTHPTVLYAIK